MEPSMIDKSLCEATYDYLNNLNNLNIPVFILTTDYIVKNSNDLAATLHNVDLNTLIGQDYLSFCSNHSLECAAIPDKIDAGALNNKIETIVNYQCNNQNRKIKWSISKLSTKNMACVGYIFLGQDITSDNDYCEGVTYLHNLSQKIIGDSCLQRRTIKEYIDDIVFHLSNIIKQMPGSVYWKDRKGRYLGGNNNVVKMMGLSSIEEFIGKTDQDFAKKLSWSEDIASSFAKDNQNVLNGKPILDREEPPFYIAEGKKIIQLSNRVPLLNKKKEVIGILGISIDITDRKRVEKLEREKRAAEERVNQLRIVASSIAHQLTVPLSGVKLALEYIRKYLPKLTRLYNKTIKTEEEIPGLTLHTIAKMDHSILQSSNRIKKAFHLIDLHLTNAKELNWHTIYDVTLLKPVSINSIIDEAINEYPFIDNEHTLINWGKSNNFEVFIEKHLIIHVLFNLIDNALKSIFEANKGEITIWLEQTDKYNIVHFKDTGMGLASDRRPSLFEPFHTTRANGTGLGLAFCKTVMKNYGGDIVARGRNNQYAHFILKFPFVADLQRYKRSYVNDRIKKKTSC